MTEGREENPNKIVIAISIVLMIINSYFAYIIGGGKIVFVLGYILTLPLIVIAISSIFKVYRNWKSRWIIILNTMLVTLVASFGNFLPAAQ